MPQRRVQDRPGDGATVTAPPPGSQSELPAQLTRDADAVQIVAKARIDPRTGAIRAMVGGYDFARSEYNRAVLARRQPGSSFKPIIYATAMNQGMSPATVVLDAKGVSTRFECSTVCSNR